MILQALKEYYDRKAADPDSGVAPEGFELKPIPFIIVVKPDGTFVALEDTREQAGKKLVAKTFVLPRSQGRSGSKSYEKTFLLWDHIGYVLGQPEDDEKSPKQHETWLNSLHSLPDDLRDDDGVAAVLKFYGSEGIAAVTAAPCWEECAKIPSCNVTFRLAGESVPIPCRPRVRDHIESTVLMAPDSRMGCCLVTGKTGVIARIHSRTPINKDTKSLVNFQKNSGYDSYGKEQGHNSPVSTSAEFAYTTALNTLLKSKTSRMLVGDAVTVCWAARETPLEDGLVDVLEGNVDIFGEPPKDEPDLGTKAVRGLFRAVQVGALAEDEKKNPFYVLGLSPNAARISIRFWIVDTVAGMAGKIVQHFEDTRIAHGPRDRDMLSLFRLLVSTAVLGKSENIPPNLAGDMMRSILDGQPYPQTLLQSSVRRNRAEQSVTYARASLIKACINRRARFDNPRTKEELKVSLDTSNINIGYRLGRLFAALEKIQAEANPGINATIRDRFYGAASGTPVVCFSNLMRLKNHHLAKLESRGRRIYFERLIAEIMDTVKDFPAHLALDEQGRFAIGYYHQVQQFYTSPTFLWSMRKPFGSKEMIKNLGHYFLQATFVLSHNDCVGAGSLL